MADQSTSATSPTTATLHPTTRHPHTLPQTPTHAYLITHTQKAAKKDTEIHDLSAQISAVYSASTGPSLSDATSQVALNLTLPIYTLHKDNLLGTHFTLRDGEGTQVAEWRNPIASVHLGHRIQIRFMDPEHKGVEGHLEGWSESFANETKKYVWEMDPVKEEQQMLFKITGSPTPKAPDGEKLLVAIFAAEKAHIPSGLLVLNQGQIDPLVCLLTLCALLDAPKSQGRIDRVAEFMFSAVAGL
ncbi:hypothetical protein BKA65DRAFT_510647 [Rhexocercosporidium sp. MPI-PUGE-AT-0058]|nr:hypothetical protein BKA65DRAFT_510647 [Rhexocercosporidium sp. MPI-PUGE-AT-0058]